LVHPTCRAFVVGFGGAQRWFWTRRKGRGRQGSRFGPPSRNWRQRWVWLRFLATVGRYSWDSKAEKVWRPALESWRLWSLGPCCSLCVPGWASTVYGARPRLLRLSLAVCWSAVRWGASPHKRPSVWPLWRSLCGGIGRISFVCGAERSTFPNFRGLSGSKFHRSTETLGWANSAC
jgi:hypothetical protein